jgi:succinate dehydrogenase / fumarate reductase iron-sulfur subunit
MATKYRTFILKVFRGSPGKQYWEEFELKLEPNLNIISALMEIQLNPVNKKGEIVAPVVWESGCLEEVCGSCSMLINGKPRQACTALIHNILQESSSNIITLAPFTKFPLVRDLIVDRSSMFENLKKVHAWVELDTTYDRGFGPKVSQKSQELQYNLSGCMTCGCCVEACPQVNENSPFMGPQAIGAAYRFQIYPSDAGKDERTEALMGKEGINGCGNAQNCAKVCPRKVRLLTAIAGAFREVTKESIARLFSSPERKEML